MRNDPGPAREERRFPPAGAAVEVARGARRRRGAAQRHHGGPVLSGKYRRVRHGPEQDSEELGFGECGRATGVLCPARAAGALTPLRVPRGNWPRGDGPHAWCPRASDNSPARTCVPRANPRPSGGRAGFCAQARGPGGLGRGRGGEEHWLIMFLRRLYTCLTTWLAFEVSSLQLRKLF